MKLILGIIPIFFRRVDTIECTTISNSAISSSDKFFYIIGDSSCTSKVARWYVLLVDDNLVLAQKWFFKNQNKLDSALITLKQKIPNLYERIKLAATEISKIKEEERIIAEQENKQAEIAAIEQQKREVREIDSLTKLVDKNLGILRSKNLVLWSWYWSYANEYSSFADVYITVINPYKQKIKYISFTFIAFNAVGDPVRDGIRGSIEKTVRGIGPIEYADRGSYNFENVFYSKVIDKMRIKQIKIQFFDGSYKIINQPVSLDRKD